MMLRRYVPVLLVLFAFTALLGCQTLQGRTAGQYVDDTSITASVKSKLAAEEPKSLTRVSVDTVNGVVHLTGVVETAEMKTRAEQLARQPDGVVRVVNNLQIEGMPAAAPAPARR